MSKSDDMLFSADSLRFLDAWVDGLHSSVRDLVLFDTLEDGRSLVTSDDMRAAVEAVIGALPRECLKDVVCPQCKMAFRLNWNDYPERSQTLMLRGCPSGGIYDVSISCPNCDYVEEL